MSIVRRVALAASPFSPVMDPKLPGRLFFYRPPAATTELRKIDFGAGSDVQLTNALPIEVGNLRPGAIAHDHYAAPTGAAPGLISFINLATGAVSTYNWSGVPGGTLSQSQIPVPLPVDNFSRFLFITKNPNVGEGNLYIEHPPAIPVYQKIIDKPEDALLKLTRGHYSNHAGAFYRIAAASAQRERVVNEHGDTGVSVPLYTIPATVGANGLSTLGFHNDFPAFFMGFADWLTDAVGTPALARQARPKFIVGFGKDTVNNELIFVTVYGRIAGGSTVSILTHTGLTLNSTGWQFDSIDASEEFGRLYFSVSTGAGPQSNGFRLFSSPMRADGSIDVLNTIDVDTGGAPTNSITGVFVVPPFIYVTKAAGPSFGAQIVQIHDSELEKKKGHRGTELWATMPEIGRYL